MNSVLSVFSGATPTLAASFTGLGDLPGGRFFSQALGVSADGSVVVGRGNSSSSLGDEAFIWDETNGMRSLQNLLESEGIDLAGWNLLNAAAISNDGLSIVGTGINPGGNREAWLVQFDSIPDSKPVPEHFTAGGLGLALRLAALFLKTKQK